MLIAVLIVGGVLGAPARYLLDGFVQNRTRSVFPWGTFAVNATGSLLLGFLSGLAIYHGLGALPKVAVGTGFCGAYTTFSTMQLELLTMVEHRRYGLALGYAGASIALGYTAVWAGGMAGRRRAGTLA